MDVERFDRWTRGLEPRISRRGLSRGIFAAVVTFGLAADTDAKKKKKKKKGPARPGPNQACAASCANGCCTSELGECIPPAQQGGARCGTGGELCHNCGSGTCKPMGDACAATDVCCADGPRHIECQEGRCCRPLRQLCTTTGECCPQLVCAPESDFDPELRCLGTTGAPCAFISDCADFLICQTGRCCAGTSWFCEIAEDCCSVEHLCQVIPGTGTEKRCCKPTGASCVNHQNCCSGSCNATGDFRCD